jgi:CRP/FNR family transcriptional regulator, cyclic AMP receptor protein
MRDVVPLFDHLPELASRAPSSAIERLRESFSVPYIALAAGSFTHWHVARGVSALILISGFVLREVRLMGRSGVHLLGPGDVIVTTPVLEAGTSVPRDASWRGLTEVKVATIDEQAERVLGQIPGATATLMERLLQRSRDQELLAAISRIRGLQSRLLILFWCLADRWGRREGGQVVLPVPLSHDVLADLVSAERPSVSQALRSMARTGVLVRRSDRTWVLTSAPPQSLSDLTLSQGQASGALLAEAGAVLAEAPRGGLSAA